MSSGLHHVAVLALDRVILLDFAIPMQVFAGQGSSPYRARACAPQPAVATTAGFGITVGEGSPG